MAPYVGEYEAIRIVKFFLEKGMDSIDFSDAYMGVSEFFEEDLDEIIAQCFDKLDLADKANLSVKYIRQGLLVNARTHINPVMKAHTKTLLKPVYDMRSTATYTKEAFSLYIRNALVTHDDPSST